MRVLLDTDILLDVALAREAFFENSALVLHWAEMEPGQAVVAWHSLSNFAYLVRPNPRPFIRDLLQFVEVAQVGTSEALRALGFPMKDFEDALQASAALSFGASYIITRNLAHYKGSPVPSLSPSTFLARIKKSGS